MHDRLGSVRQVFDYDASRTPAIQVKNIYTYDAFGKRLTGSGPYWDTQENVYNPFQFTGQWYDTEIGQYYLRARQYDPQLARFTSRDPVFGGYEDPMSLHRYLYCWNNPVNNVDLDGEMLIDITLSQGLSAGLRGYGMYGTAKRMGPRINYCQ
jgi:RHS repeat-associated protein